MTIHHQEENPGQKGASNATWERPTLTYLSNIRDLVRGGGKTGPMDDSDPQNTLKIGVG